MENLTLNMLASNGRLCIWLEIMTRDACLGRVQGWKCDLGAFRGGWSRDWEKEAPPQERAFLCRSQPSNIPPLQKRRPLGDKMNDSIGVGIILFLAGSFPVCTTFFPAPSQGRAQSFKEKSPRFISSKH